MILVDEPTAGLAKLLSEEVYRMLTDLRDREGLTILLVDQEIREALKIADYVYVLELGRNKFEGPASDFDDLEKSFLGLIPRILESLSDSHNLEKCRQRICAL